MDHGVEWQCVSDVSIKETSIPFFWDSERRNNRVAYSVCANPDHPVEGVLDECEQECEDHFSGVIKFMAGTECNAQGKCEASEWEFLNASATCSNTDGPIRTGQPCNEGDKLYMVEEFGQWSEALLDSSRIHLEADGESGSAVMSGKIGYSILPDPRIAPCPAEGCKIGLTRFALTAAGTSIGGKDVTDMEASAPRVIEGTLKPDGSVVFPAANFVVQTRFKFDRKQGSKLVTAAHDVTGRINPMTNTFVLDEIALSIDELSAKVNVQAAMTARPPEARIAPQPVVECNAPNGANVTISGTSSFDPDNDINSYAWYNLPPPRTQRVFLGTGKTLNSVTATLPLGENTVGLFVFDDRAAFGFQSTKIRVVDTTPPSLTAPPDVVKESCEPGGEAIDVGFPVLSDACDPNVQLSAAIVDINGVPSNIPLTSGFAFKQGTTIIEYKVTDAAGHVTVARQNVTLDIGASCCPAEMQKVLGTPGNDTLEGSNGSQCMVGFAGNDHLYASNNADMLIGGSGDDILDAGNNIEVPEKIFGGAGNDTIDGGNGADTIWGGLGDDHILGGNGADVIRGGPGADKLYGENNDDVFIIGAVCEIKPGEVIDGGLGFHDRLETPVPLEQLRAMGVTVVNVEEIVVTAPRADAECVD